MGYRTLDIKLLAYAVQAARFIVADTARTMAQYSPRLIALPPPGICDSHMTCACEVHLCGRPSEFEASNRQTHLSWDRENLMGTYVRMRSKQCTYCGRHCVNYDKRSARLIALLTPPYNSDMTSACEVHLFGGPSEFEALKRRKKNAAFME